MSVATMTASNPFVASTGGGEGGLYELCPAGNRPAYLSAIIDLGTHDTEYGGQAKPDVRHLCFAWELSGTKKKDGKPFVLCSVFTISVNNDGTFFAGDRANLRKMMEGWLGRKYGPKESIDFGSQLGKPCLVNVTHSEKGDKQYHNVGSISAMIEGIPMPPRAYEPIAFHISMGTPPPLDHLPFVYAGSPKSMQSVEDVIAQSKEARGIPIGKGGTTPYSEPVGARPLPAHVPLSDDDIPY
jgi:hypothetical protein